MSSFIFIWILCYTITTLFACFIYYISSCFFFICCSCYISCDFSTFVSVPTGRTICLWISRFCIICKRWIFIFCIFFIIMIRVLVSYFICYSLFTEPCFCVSYFRCRNNCSCSSRSSLFYSSTSTSCICIYYYSLSLCFMSCFSISCKTIFFLFYIYSFCIHNC